MDYKSQKQIVIEIYRDNLRNSFLESWKLYHKEKAKLERILRNDFKTNFYLHGLQRVSVKYNPETDSFDIKIKKSFKERFKSRYPPETLKEIYGSSFNLN